MKTPTIDTDMLNAVSAHASRQPAAERDELRRLVALARTMLELTGADNIEQALGMIKAWKALEAKFEGKKSN